MPATSSPISEQWLTDVLAALGDSADQIATSLRTAGITGVRGDPFECPIARYLAQRARERADGTPVRITVYDDAIALDQDAAPDELHLLVQPPDAVRDFIAKCDTDNYTDLVHERR